MSYVESFDGVNPYGATDNLSHVVVTDGTAIFKLSDCLLSAGVYTLQFWVKASDVLSVAIEASGLYKSIDTSTEWVRYVYTFTVINSSNGSINFNLPVGIYYFYGMKVEQGDTATEWTPAPENSGVVPDTVTEYQLNRLSDRYSDKLGCYNGVWYIERNTETITLNGSEDWWADGGIFGMSIEMRGDDKKALPALCDRFIYDANYHSDINHFSVGNENNSTHISFTPDTSIASTVAGWKTWLSNNNVNVLIPANPTTVRLANYLQTALNGVVANDNLYTYFTENEVHGLRGAIVVKPIVFGELNSDMTALINNQSDDEIGFIYQITCTGEVHDPVIYHSETNQSIKVNGTYKLDDVITIDTRRGKKSVSKSYRGTTTNIINSLDNTSKWLQLNSGYNHLIQSATSGVENMSSMVIYTNEYEGV